MFITLRKQIETFAISMLSKINPRIAKSILFRKESLSKSKLLKRKIEAEIVLLPFFLNPYSCYIDIGANRGLYCFYAEKLINQINIIAFEPIPNLASLLKRLYPKSCIVQKAVSDVSGISIMTIPKHKNQYFLDTRSTLEKLPGNLENDSIEINVETISLDEYATRTILSNIDLIKIDVEGHEQRVLTGAKSIILKYKPFMIVEIEVAYHLDKIVNIWNFIIELGYVIYYIDPTRLQLESVIFDNSHQQVANFELMEVHNYVCIPDEKRNVVFEINRSLAINY